MSKKITSLVFVIIFSITTGTAVLAEPVPVNTVPTVTGNSSNNNPAAVPTTPTGGIGSVIRQVGGQTKLPNYDAGHSSQNYQSGASQITSTIYFLLDFFKYILGGIAVMMLIISGLKLILSGRQVADAMSKEKETLSYAFTGLVLIIVADQLIRGFFGAEGEIYRTGADMQMAAEAGSNLASGFTGLIRIFIPSIAVLSIVMAGFRLLISRGDNDKLTKAKKQITWAILGLVLAGLSEIIIFRVIFPDKGTRIPDAIEFAKLVITMTNFIAGFISTIAVIMIIYAGYLYVVSLGGNGLDKAKTILKGALIGLVIAMGAFALVNTFVKVEPIQTSISTKEVLIPGTGR
jgi:hypothetical protein